MSNGRASRLTETRQSISDPKRPFARRSRWGTVDAVSPSEAAYVRSLIDGTEQLYESRLSFKRRSAKLTDDAKAALVALADYLEVKPDIMLVMLEGHADDMTGNRRNHDPQRSARQCRTKLFD